MVMMSGRFACGRRPHAKQAGGSPTAMPFAPQEHSRYWACSLKFGIFAMSYLLPLQCRRRPARNRGVKPGLFGVLHMTPFSRQRPTRALTAALRPFGRAARPFPERGLFQQPAQPAAPRARLAGAFGSTRGGVAPLAAGRGPGGPGREARASPRACLLQEAYFPAHGHAVARGRPPFPATHVLHKPAAQHARLADGCGST